MTSAASRLLRLALRLAPAAAPGCAFLGGGDPGITFASEPAGAIVLVDGKDSGFVTPCRIALDTGERYEVELRKEGYAPARIRLEGATRKSAVLWKDMVVRSDIWRFPLWLNLKDSLQPFEIEATIEPGRVYARLTRAADR